MKAPAVLASLGLVATVGLGACSGAPNPATASDTSGAFPMTVSSCGVDVTVAEQADRVVTASASAVTMLLAAGGRDKLVARFEIDEDPYPPAMAAQLEGVTRIPYERGALSKEAVLDLEPDVLLDANQPGFEIDTMARLGVANLISSGLCGGTLFITTKGDGTEDFDDVYRDIETYGRVLGTGDQAAASVAELRRRVADVEARARAAAAKPATAAFVNIYQGAAGVYGTASMSHTQLQALGIKNVFDDLPDRITDVNAETVIQRDPELIVLLAFQQTDDEAKQAFLSLPGVSGMRAVRDNKIVVVDYYYSAASTLAVDGLEGLARQLGV